MGDWTAKPEVAEGAEVRRSGRTSPFVENRITESVIGSAIEVHRLLGPGLLESAYEEALCYELSHSGLAFQRQVPIPIIYKGLRLSASLKLDLLIEDAIIVELKTVDEILPIHKSQLLTYLKASRKSVGLLINFNVPILKNGIKRMVNHHIDTPEAPTLSAPSALASGDDSHHKETPRSLSALCVSAVKGPR